MVKMDTIFERSQYKYVLVLIGCSIKIKSVSKKYFMKGILDVMASESTRFLVLSWIGFPIVLLSNFRPCQGPSWILQLSWPGLIHTLREPLSCSAWYRVQVQGSSSGGGRTQETRKVFTVRSMSRTPGYCSSALHPPTSVMKWGILFLSTFPSKWREEKGLGQDWDEDVDGGQRSGAERKWASLKQDSKNCGCRVSG